MARQPRNLHSTKKKSNQTGPLPSTFLFIRLMNNNRNNLRQNTFKCWAPSICPQFSTHTARASILFFSKIQFRVGKLGQVPPGGLQHTSTWACPVKREVARICLHDRTRRLFVSHFNSAFIHFVVCRLPLTTSSGPIRKKKNFN